MERYYYVYILAKARNSTFYTGVTNDLIRRVYEHKMGIADGFTKKYGIKTLVYYEQHQDINAAIWREKLIKKWKRDYKLNIIETMNPDWKDLYDDLTAPTPTTCHTAAWRYPADCPGNPGKSKAFAPDPAIRRGDNVTEAPHG